MQRRTASTIDVGRRLRAGLRTLAESGERNMAVDSTFQQEK